MFSSRKFPTLILYFIISDRSNARFIYFITRIVGNLYARFDPSVYDKCFPSENIFRHTTRCWTWGKIISYTLYTVLRSHKIRPFISKVIRLQHLLEKVWYAVTETCLAFTVFRDDFSPKFVALFTLLLFLKSFHWLAEDRVDYVSNANEFPKVSLQSVTR